MPNRLDTIKSIIGKHGGYAPNNRFNVIFTPPTVSLLNLNPTNILGNIINNNFSWKDLISDPRDISILCKSASLPSRNINTAEYQNTREQKKYVQGKTDGDLTTIFYVTNDAIINYLSQTDIKFYHFIFYGIPIFLCFPFYFLINGTLKKHIKCEKS